MYIVVCPKCGSKSLQLDYNKFICNDCENEFDLEEAEGKYL